MELTQDQIEAIKAWIVAQAAADTIAHKKMLVIIGPQSSAKTCLAITAAKLIGKHTFQAFPSTRVYQYELGDSKTIIYSDSILRNHQGINTISSFAVSNMAVDPDSNKPIILKDVSFIAILEKDFLHEDVKRRSLVIELPEIEASRNVTCPMADHYYLKVLQDEPQP